MVRFKYAALFAVLMAVPAVQANAEDVKKPSTLSRLTRFTGRSAVYLTTRTMAACAVVFATAPVFNQTVFSNNQTDGVGMRIANEYKRNIKTVWAKVVNFANSTAETAATAQKAVEDKAPQAKVEQIVKDTQVKAEETKQAAHGLVLLAQHKAVKNYNKAVKKLTKWWNRA